MNAKELHPNKNLRNICYINNILEIKWWDWDIEKIIKNLEIILGNNVNKLKEL